MNELPLNILDPTFCAQAFSVFFAFESRDSKTQFKCSTCWCREREFGYALASPLGGTPCPRDRHRPHIRCTDGTTKNQTALTNSVSKRPSRTRHAQPPPRAHKGCTWPQPSDNESCTPLGSQVCGARAYACARILALASTPNTLRLSHTGSPTHPFTLYSTLID